LVDYCRVRASLDPAGRRSDHRCRPFARLRAPITAFGDRLKSFGPSLSASHNRSEGLNPSCARRRSGSQSRTEPFGRFAPLPKPKILRPEVALGFFGSRPKCCSLWLRRVRHIGSATAWTLRTEPAQAQFARKLANPNEPKKTKRTPSTRIQVRL